MSDIRKPQITSPTPEGQLLQVKSYLIQLVDQLNYALHTIENQLGNVTVNNSGTSLDSAVAVFSEIKGLIMKSSDIVNAHFAQMEPMICESEMLLEKIAAMSGGGSAEDIVFADGETFQQKYDSGELTGPQGEKGEKGDTGAQGPQGPKGDTGATGPEGPQGPQGIQGIPGETGPQGEKGDRGEQGIQGEKGEKGDTGPQGEKGADGAKGADGRTPVKGTDYYTEADKNEMVGLVLAALPTWSGGSY